MRERLWMHLVLFFLLLSIACQPKSGGLRTRNLMSRDGAFYDHSLTAGAGWQGLIQGYCGSDRCDLWRSANAAIQQGEWHLLCAEVEGNQQRTYLSGQLKVTQNLTNRSNSNAGMHASQGTTICVDDIVVRSLDRSPEALAFATEGVALQSVTLYTSVNGIDEVGSVAQVRAVYLIDWNADQTWAYVRQDATGLQGWAPAEGG